MTQAPYSTAIFISALGLLFASIVGLSLTTLLLVAAGMFSTQFLLHIVQLNQRAGEGPRELIRMSKSLLIALFALIFTLAALGVVLGGESRGIIAAISFWVAAVAFLLSYMTLSPQQILSPPSTKILVDLTCLEDGRLADLAQTGLLDQKLIIPTYLPDELSKLAETATEPQKTKARKALEVLHKIESLPKLEPLFSSQPSPGEGDLATKLLYTAKSLNAYILTTEIPSAKVEGVNFISLDAIASAVKHGPQRGEIISIKIQRIGKEPRQGVGYLDDGTMVVVNGAGEYLGKTIFAQVLSQKFSSTGKIIFCNAQEDAEAPLTL